jgi:hypothetical protein
MFFFRAKKAYRRSKCVAALIHSLGFRLERVEPTLQSSYPLETTSVQIELKASGGAVDRGTALRT